MNKKFITSILFVSILISLLSCAKNNEKTITTTTDPSVTDTQSVEVKSEPTNSSIISEKYADIDYGGAKFRILSPSPGSHFYKITRDTENEIFYEEETGDVLNDSIFQRNKLTEELLNVKIEPIWGKDTDNVSSTVKKSVMAGDNNYEAILNRLDFSLNSSAEGYLLNLRNIDTMDVSNSWWDENIVKGFTMFNDKLYAISGDINYYDDYAVQTIYFNKNIMKDMGFEYPYQMVKDGTWTFDVMTEMAMKTTRDLNGDTKLTQKDDLWGFGDHGASILHFLYPFGENMAYTDKDGVIRVNNNSENLINVVDRLYKFFTESGKVNINNPMDTFKEGRELFFAEMVGSLGGFRELPFEFGILPMPKGNISQERYLSYVSNGWTTAFSVPTTNPNPSQTGVILETLCAFSTDTVIKSLYNVLLEEKYIRDVESQEMLPYIFDSKVYDWAGDLAWASDLRSVYENLLVSKSNNFVSSMEKKINSINKKLDNFIGAYKDE